MTAPAGSNPAATPDRTAHVVQMGEAPVFIGEGSNDLACACLGSVLIKGFLPQNFLAIGIQCFRCGAVTTTPGLAADGVLARNVMAVERRALPALTSSNVSRGMVLVSQDLVADYALTQPRDPATEPLVLSADSVAAIAAEYDRLSGGALAAQMAATRNTPLDATDHAFAWSMARLNAKFGTPDWSWIYENDDAMAAMHVAAFRQFLDCWGHHPRLAQMAPSLAAPRRFLAVMASFATARLLHEGGNRIRLDVSAADQGGVDLADNEGPISLAMRFPEALQWAARERAGLEVIRTTVSEAVATTQGKVNLSRPGMVVLGVSILHPDFDQTLIDGMQAALRSTGRKHRGVAAVAAIIPKPLQTARLDQIGFGYAFYPVRNPRFIGENPVRLIMPEGQA